MSESTDLNPVIRLMVTGKKVNSTTTMILGAIPVPIQMSSIGANVNTGIVCDAIKNGYTDRSSNLDQNIAVAIAHANVIETANPIRIS